MDLNRLQCNCCGSVGFYQDDLDSGFYCCGCNSQAEGIIDTAIEVDEALINSAYGRAHLSSQSVPDMKLEPQTQKPVDKMLEVASISYSFDDEISVPLDFGNAKRPHLSAEAVANGVRLRYIQGIQLMIQMQCEALMEKFGVSPMVCGLVGTIWLRFVASSDVFGNGWIEDAIYDSEVEYRSRLGGEGVVTAEETNAAQHVAHGYGSEPCNMYGERAAVIWLRSLKKKIPRESSLAVSFLACHLAREAVLPTDIGQWALMGKIPYLAAFMEIEKYLGGPTSACPFSSRSMFRPLRAIRSGQLEALAGNIAMSIGLRLPPVNFYLIASRFLRKLILPLAKILPKACNMYEWLMPPDLWLSSNPNKLPTRACVMSIIIVTIRVLYNLHGYGAWESSLSMAKPLDKNLLEKEAADDYDSQELVSHLEKVYDKLCEIPEYVKDLSMYLKYCKDVVFSGLKTSYEEENLAKQLWSSYESQEDDIGSVMVDQKCAKAEVSTPLDDKNVDIEMRSFKVEPHDSISFDGDRKAESKGCSTQRQSGERCSTLMGKNHLSDVVAISRMKMIMEKNNFCYLPPRKIHYRVNRYLCYRRRKVDGMLHYPVHADYFLLLRACARVVHLDVRVMHGSVLTLERRLSQIEDWIKESLVLTKDQCHHDQNGNSMNVGGHEDLDFVE